jgi:hypothetical protein
MVPYMVDRESIGGGIGMSVGTSDFQMFIWTQLLEDKMR